MKKRARFTMLFDKLQANTCTPGEADELIALLSMRRQGPESLQLLLERLSAPTPADPPGDRVQEKLKHGLEQILKPKKPVKNDERNASWQ